MATPGRTTRASARLNAKQNNSPSLTTSFLQRNRSNSNGNLGVNRESISGSAEEEQDEDEYQASSNETEDDESPRHQMGLHLSSNDLITSIQAVEGDFPPATSENTTTSPGLKTGNMINSLQHSKKSKSSFLDTLSQAITSQIQPFHSPTLFDLPDNVKAQCEEAANQYIQNCKRFHINIDASVVTALQTGKSIEL